MTQRQRRHFQYLISTGCLLCLLGIGNIGFGCIKYNEYENSYNEISARLVELKKAPKKVMDNLSGEAKIYDVKSQKIENLKQLKRSQNRMNFYHFFVTGGKIFISISLLSFLLAGIMYKKNHT